MERRNVLTFDCYLAEAESGIYSNEQIHRIRPMKLIYHLTDDSITLNEPVVPNSGMLQVKFDFFAKIFHEINTSNHINRPKFTLTVLVYAYYI